VTFRLGREKRARKRIYGFGSSDQRCCLDEERSSIIRAVSRSLRRNAKIQATRITAAAQINQSGLTIAMLDEIIEGGD